MTFHEDRFPTAISFGSSGGPERRTHVVTLANGFEERNTPWAQSRRRYDAGLGVRHLEDLSRVVAFFEARRGKLFGFRWKDWADFTSGEASGEPSAMDQVIGEGDGNTVSFQLVKRYQSGGHAEARHIRKPVDGSVLVAVDGVAATGWTVDPSTGVVTFDGPPASGLSVTAGFAFDVPVRFDTDFLEVTAAAFDAGAVPSIPVVEVRI